MTRAQSSYTKSIDQRSAVNRGFPLSTPASLHMESWQSGLGEYRSTVTGSQTVVVTLALYDIHKLALAYMKAMSLYKIRYIAAKSS